MFRLEEELTVQNVEQVRREIIEYLENQAGGTEIILDASNLQNIDAAGVQLLLSCCKQKFASKENDVKVSNVNEQVKHIFEVCGSLHVLKVENDGV